ncbi:ribonuclease M5 [Spiroplasma endosymbiont of Amphibalanus improvisus]|uniref:ribonuclease M5 n=1 Tax=Spiroplasma endosymbiont of Amphibalanus improvisus TaxID=3066327 RepID=UPI00313DB036
MKEKNKIIVVEGMMDKIKINSFLKVPIIITNGSAVSEKTLNLIKKLSLNNEIIIFTDPDFQGKRIRKIISESLNNNCKHAFIKKELATKGKKIGVAEANIKDLKESLAKIYNIENNNKICLTWNDFINLKIYNDKKLRFKICDYLNIEKCNNKSFFKWVNLLSINKIQLKQIIIEVHNELNKNN